MNITCDMASGPDKTVLTLRQGSRYIPLPPEYETAGAAMSMTVYGDRVIIAHPDHAPYVYKDGKWERITCPL